MKAGQNNKYDVKKKSCTGLMKMPKFQIMKKRD